MKKIEPIIKTVDTWNNQRKMPFGGKISFGIGGFVPSVDDESPVRVAAVHMKWLGGIVYTSAKSARAGATGWLQIPTSENSAHPVVPISPRRMIASGLTVNW